MTDPRIERVRAAHAAALAAQAAEVQAVRDALADRALSVARLTREAYGSDNRQRVYAMLARAEGGGEPTPPRLTPVVLLRGAGQSDETWTAVERAMWARGWATTRHRESAWHLARGGTPVALCDWSTRWTGETVHVGRARARYQDLEDGGVDHELVVDAEPQPRPVLPGGGLDVPRLALLVADALA